MTTLRVLLHAAAKRGYELHSLDFSTAFLQGRLHEEIWLQCPPGFTSTFPPGIQCSLRRPVYGLRQAPRASQVLSVGAAATTRLVPAFVAGSGATSPTAQLSFTLESGATGCFFRDCTKLTPLHTSVTFALADPSVGSVVAESTTTLPCSAAPSGFLTGYYTPSFSRNLEAEQQRLRDLPDSAPARFVRGPLPSPPVLPVESLSSSQWTRRSPLSHAVSREPPRSCYRADGPFHLVLCSHVPPPPIFPRPPKSSLTVFHDPLSDYLRASCPLVSRVLSALVTHLTAPLSSVSALDTTVAGFASSNRLDYAAHLVSGPAHSPSSGGALVFPLEVVAEEAEMASYRSTGTYVDAVPPPGANVVSGMWLYKVKRPPGAPPVFKARYVARGFSQQEGVDFFQTFAPTPKMTTLRVLVHIAAHRDYELHSLDFSTAFLQGSLHEQIWLRRSRCFTALSLLGPTGSCIDQSTACARLPASGTTCYVRLLQRLTSFRRLPTRRCSSVVARPRSLFWSTLTTWSSPLPTDMYGLREGGTAEETYLH
ncbi:unnamed protein product [Closterium sp. NIES-54]